MYSTLTLQYCRYHKWSIERLVIKTTIDPYLADLWRWYLPCELSDIPSGLLLANRCHQGAPGWRSPSEYRSVTGGTTRQHTGLRWGTSNTRNSPQSSLPVWSAGCCLPDFRFPTLKRSRHRPPPHSYYEAVLDSSLPPTSGRLSLVSSSPATELSQSEDGSCEVESINWDRSVWGRQEGLLFLQTGWSLTMMLYNTFLRWQDSW